MWTLAGYGDELERATPGLRKMMAEMRRGRGFEGRRRQHQPHRRRPKRVPAHWSVTFGTDDADATGAKATELGGTLVMPPFDAPWVRMTIVRDPQGATFIASQFVRRTENWAANEQSRDRADALHPHGRGHRRGLPDPARGPRTEPRRPPDVLVGMLSDLSADAAYNLNRRDHCLQTATRALRDGADEELVVVALFHDVGESLGPLNHGEVAAAVLRPFVSDDNYWLLAHHPLFQTYFYARHLGLDPNARDKFKGEPAYQKTIDFCAAGTRCRSIPPTPTSHWPRSNRWSTGS
jgi:hypothetical protein